MTACAPCQAGDHGSCRDERAMGSGFPGFRCTCCYPDASAPPPWKRKAPLAVEGVALVAPRPRALADHLLDAMRSDAEPWSLERLHALVGHSYEATPEETRAALEELVQRGDAFPAEARPEPAPTCGHQRDERPVPCRKAVST